MQKNKKIVKALAMAGIFGGLSMTAGQASAHWSSGPFLYNDAGSNPMHLSNANLTNPATGTSYGTYTQNRTVTSNYGWIQGQDTSLWANSHDNKGLAFSLGNTAKITFTVNTLGTASSVVQTGSTSATALSGTDWTPAFPLFSGLAAQSSHEGGIGNSVLTGNLPGYINWSPYAAASAYSASTEANYEANTGNSYTGSGTWGAYRSNGDWYSGRDISDTATFGDGTLIGTDQTLGGNNNTKLTYLNAASGAAGSHTVSATYILGPGNYSLWVGGTDAAAAAAQEGNYQALLAAKLANDTAGIAAANAAITAGRKSYGFTVQTTVAPVPLPAAVWLFGSALAGMGVFGRRKPRQEA